MQLMSIELLTFTNKKIKYLTSSSSNIQNAF